MGASLSFSRLTSGLSRAIGGSSEMKVPWWSTVPSAKFGEIEDDRLHANVSLAVVAGSEVAIAQHDGLTEFGGENRLFSGIGKT